MHGQGDFRNTIYDFGTSDQGLHYDMLRYKVATNYEDFFLSSWGFQNLSCSLHHNAIIQPTLVDLTLVVDV